MQHIRHDLIQNSPYTGLEKALGFQEVGVPKISRQSAHENGKFVNPRHRPSLPQEIALVLTSVRG